MRVLYVTAELSPLVSTGGLAEVAYALPKTLNNIGIDIRVALPKYKSINIKETITQNKPCLFDVSKNSYQAKLLETNIPGTTIPLYLIEHEELFGRDYVYGYGDWEYEDNPRRFSLFCNAVLDAMEQIQWKPDIIHCNDWATSAILPFLLIQLEHNPFWQNTNTLLTIHNLAFQGRYPGSRYTSTGLPGEFFNSNCFEHYGDMNLLKGGILLADKINTVSPTYAIEIQTLEYGFGLDNILRFRSDDLSGILNGVDYSIWSPKNDKYIETNYSKDTLANKEICKSSLLKKVNLPEQNVPLIGIISRLYWQKGIDILIQSLPELLQLDLQMIILGSGDPKYETQLKEISSLFPKKIRTVLGYNTELSHQIIAGSDFTLMPSRYEPCGLTQLYAFAYGTIPIVRKVGGLADSVTNITSDNIRNKCATGITFRALTPKSIIRSVKNAIDLFQNKDILSSIRINGMKQDFSWDKQAKLYQKLYDNLFQ
ncbi:MAG TPA: glycogen synthase GlgA [Candidatus Hydrogenedens sp.]|nr:glycogen synthase GlgA [Candidatus Hydrogenedens sp.]